MKVRIETRGTSDIEESFKLQPVQIQPATLNINGRDVQVTNKMQQTLNILQSSGFSKNDPLVIQTVLRQEMGDQIEEKNDKYRTKCFINDEERIQAHMRAVFRSIGKTE